MSLGILANVTPYYFLYQIIAPLTRGEKIELSYVLVRVAAEAVSEKYSRLLTRREILYIIVSRC